MSRHTHSRGRRWIPITVLVVLVAGAGAAVLGIQIRATAAAADRERTAQQAAVRAAELAAEQAAAEQAASAQAETTAALAAAWAAAATEAAEAVDAAGVLLSDSEGEVAEEATRTAVAAAVAGTEVALATGSEPPTTAEVDALTDATQSLRDASAALTAAHESWLADRATTKTATPSSTSPPTAAWTAGAGPDCGGPDSYEPPTTGGGLYTSVPTTDGDGTNGRLARSSMSALSWCADVKGHQQWLRADAAAALTRLNSAFRDEFGENIAVDLSYRSYADQVRARDLYGSLAAAPGTSNHGWGTAFDVWEWKAYSFGSARYSWLVANGPSYGWVLPAATESGNPEYWHFEYTG